MKTFVILPHQLFDVKYLDKKYKYVIYEHPHYFTTYNYNKKKIILHRGSMKYYQNHLKNKGYDILISINSSTFRNILYLIQ